MRLTRTTLRAPAAHCDPPLTLTNSKTTTRPAPHDLKTNSLGDWVALDVPNNKLVANINYLVAAQQAAEMAAAVGLPSDAAAYLALASLLSDSIARKWWNESAAHWDAGSQSAQALALAAGAGGPALAAPTAAALLAALAAASGHVTVGASGASVILGALHDGAGRPDAALALAQQPTFPCV